MFAALTRQNVDGAYRLAWAILRDGAAADDATQDAFAIAWRKRSSLRDADRFDAWFGRILVNVCRDRLDPDHRIVVILRYWADLQVDDIAARVGIPAGTVKSRLHAALKTMRPRLEDPR